MAIKTFGHCRRLSSRAVATTSLPALFLAAAAVLAGQAPSPHGVDVQGVVRVGGKPTANAVVWLEAPNAPRTQSPPRVVLDQRNLNFSPRVLAVRVGTTVEFPNNDRVFHNVFSFIDGKRFDLGMYPVGTMRPVTFDRPGLSRIFCNIHPNMAAYILAVDTPYFAVSDGSGAFNLKSVPPNRYKYHAWRSGAQELSGDWESGANDARLTVEWPS